MQNDDQNPKGIQRRKLIKSAVIGGGVVGAVGSLPSKWTTPVMNMVATPAHAQTSAATIVPGTYSTASPIALAPRSNRSGPQFALLDVLISPANANHFTQNFCGTSDDDSVAEPGTSHLHIRVNEDMTVDVSIDSVGGDDGTSTTCEYTSPRVSVASDGMSIPDVEFMFFDDGVAVVINNISLSAEGAISGNYVAGGDECSGTFTTIIGGSYPSETTECTGGGVL